MKKNNLLIATALLSTLFALTACNGGGGSSQGYTPQSGLTCVASESTGVIPYGQTGTITAYVPSPQTGTVSFSGVGSPITSGGNTCQLNNSESCTLTYTNTNTTGSTLPSGVSEVVFSNWTAGGCNIAGLLSQ